MSYMAYWETVRLVDNKVRKQQETDLKQKQGCQQDKHLSKYEKTMHKPFSHEAPYIYIYIKLVTGIKNSYHIFLLQFGSGIVVCFVQTVLNRAIFSLM